MPYLQELSTLLWLLQVSGAFPCCSDLVKRLTQWIDGVPKRQERGLPCVVHVFTFLGKENILLIRCFFLFYD